MSFLFKFERTGKQNKEAALSKKNVLLHGPSGTGKELAAALFSQRVAPKAAFVRHNAALFATEEEAATTLFGVESHVFSGVHHRKGVIEEAKGGVLFLDETHNLPPRLQKSLLRVIETGETRRIGNNHPVSADIRFVFASNATDPTAGLVHDLYARLHVVHIPSLKERTADIPSIFLAVLNNVCKAHGLDPAPIVRHLKGDHMETLCLATFETDNIRGLIDLADRIAANIGAKIPLPAAVDDVFTERFHDNPVAHRQELKTASDPNEGYASVYEQNKQLIVTIHHRLDGNISAMERALKARGISCSRRWLTHYVRTWGLRR